MKGANVLRLLHFVLSIIGLKYWVQIDGSTTCEYLSYYSGHQAVKYLTNKKDKAVLCFVIMHTRE